jgi:hypothetical protein
VANGLSHSLDGIATELASGCRIQNYHCGLGNLLKLTAPFHSLDGRVVDYSTPILSPGFFAFMLSGGLIHVIYADGTAKSNNQSFN